MNRSLPLAFTICDFERAHLEWGCNCGPGALAAILEIGLEAARDLLPGFIQKRYTSPQMMLAGLSERSHSWSARDFGRENGFADYGLNRVQWLGPWMSGKDRGSRMAQYQRTHWIASADGWVFDINNDLFDQCALRWLSRVTWVEYIAPKMVSAVPRATNWAITHRIELSR